MTPLFARRKLASIAAIIFALGSLAVLIFALSNVTRFMQTVGVKRVETPVKVVALTYDDGPNPLATEALLQVLQQHHVKATFFVVGRQVMRYPQIVQREIAAGHEMGNHTFTHRDLLFKQTYFLWDQLGETDLVLRRLGATGALHIRPPRGRGFLGLVTLARLMHKQIVMWDVDPADYRKERSPQQIADHILREVRPGSIVLLHDGGGDRSRTVAASAIVIPQLKAQGYQFLTISELLNMNSG